MASHLFNDEDFYEIKSSCISSQTLYEDSEFPWGKTGQKYELKRPIEIEQDKNTSLDYSAAKEVAKFYVDGISRFDVCQGYLGDCYLIAAITSLSMNPKLMKQVVCEDNGDFNDEDYCGIFHFRFWYYGNWVDVVIDDTLPTEDNQLVFMNSTIENEYWSALLEKAYAKLHGGYDKIGEGGIAAHVLSELTGGVTEDYYLKDPPENLYKNLMKSFKRKTLMNCSISGRADEEKSFFTSAKLSDCHVYTITQLEVIKTQDEESVELIRVRNPWGNGYEWNGDWSDDSETWNNVSDEEKERIGFDVKEDGEFYICFNDFLKFFDFVEICNLSPDSIESDPNSDRKWQMFEFYGEMDENSAHNFELDDPDEDDDEELCTVVVSLIIIDEEDLNDFSYKISTAESCIECVDETSLKCIRENVKRYSLEPGNYTIQPYGDKNYNYLIRIFYEVKNE